MSSSSRDPFLSLESFGEPTETECLQDLQELPEHDDMTESYAECDICGEYVDELREDTLGDMRCASCYAEHEASLEECAGCGELLPGDTMRGVGKSCISTNDPDYDDRLFCESCFKHHDPEYIAYCREEAALQRAEDRREREEEGW